MDIYGSQESLIYEQVLKIKGEVISLRKNLIKAYLDGLSDLEYAILFQNEEPEDDEALDFINKMTTDELIDYYLKSEKFI